MNTERLSCWVLVLQSESKHLRVFLINFVAHVSPVMSVDQRRNCLADGYVVTYGNHRFQLCLQFHR